MQSQEYRLAAEDNFRQVQTKDSPLSADMEECMIDLRQQPDEMLEWQADDTRAHCDETSYRCSGATKTGFLEGLLASAPYKGRGRGMRGDGYRDGGSGRDGDEGR